MSWPVERVSLCLEKPCRTKEVTEKRDCKYYKQNRDGIVGQGNRERRTRWAVSIKTGGAPKSSKLFMPQHKLCCTSVYECIESLLCCCCSGWRDFVQLTPKPYFFLLLLLSDHFTLFISPFISPPPPTPTWRVPTRLSRSQWGRCRELRRAVHRWSVEDRSADPGEELGP